MKISKFPERIRQLNSGVDPRDLYFFIPINNFANGIDADYVNEHGIWAILASLEVALHDAIGDAEEYDSVLKDEELC
jgi:hypothetical protein